MTTNVEKDKNLLGTSLLNRWTTDTTSSLLSSITTSQSLNLRGSLTKDVKEGKKHKLESVENVGQKKCKTGASLLSGGLVTGGLFHASSLSKSLLTSSLLTSSSLTTQASGLAMNLESPLSRLLIREHKDDKPSKPSHSSPGMTSDFSPKASDRAFKKSVTISSLSKTTVKKNILPVKKMPCTNTTDLSRSKLGRSMKKKMKLVDGTAITPNTEIYDMEPPDYNFRSDETTSTEMTLVSFIPPEKDFELMEKVRAPLMDVTGLKNGLVNSVSASLLCSPNFRNPEDPSRLQLVAMTEKILVYDPEFVLKVALYTRRELNIRTTTNFMLALASNHAECRPFLRKYYSASIMLPSDWIEVAEIYQAFRDSSLNFGSLPSALRKVMITKFPDFDKYQLAKYNKGQGKKKKHVKDAKALTETTSSLMHGDRKRKANMMDIADPAFLHSSSTDLEETLGESETEEELELKTFSLKQLIRKLHITEPVEHVMCLIGKKYPLTPEEFYQSRLPGTWDEERAGKRMKLPVPETWETQVSLKGNKPETWQDLIDHKKLPFMAMLRNLRNMIKAGISHKHHNMIIRRLTDQRQVTNSKQFPFQFFSAYEVLQTLENEYHTSQKMIVESAVRDSRSFSVVTRSNAGRQVRGRGVGRGRGRRSGVDGGKVDWWVKREERKKAANAKPKETAYDLNIIQRYRKAVDTAVKIATVHNVPPIRGRTVIICSLSSKMNTPCQAAKRGLGKPRTIAEVSLLLALMCKYSCEESELIVYKGSSYMSVEVEKGTILDNMERVLNTDFHTGYMEQKASTWDESKKSDMDGGFPHWVLGEKLRDRVQIDNLIVLAFNLEPYQSLGRDLLSFIHPYRRLVNPNLLFVGICAVGSGCKFNTEIKPEHKNDIYISGFSDSILRFIAERGSGGQLLHVENIDKAYNLQSSSSLQVETFKKSEPSSIERPLPIRSRVPRWRTARVFISSTFRDMHGERDLLTRFVFPELQALGRQHFINVFEVDLRWGVSEEDTKNNRTLGLCLQEMTSCQLFIGLLGSRYGWVPAPHQIPDAPEFDCVRQYPSGASVTELEMHLGALKNIESSKGKAFFFLRNSSFENDIPKGFATDFLSESEDAKSRLCKLKDRVRSSGLEVFDGYPCKWGGVVENKPMVAGLEEFGQRALNNLWLAVRELYPDEDAVLDEDTHIMRLHRAFVDSRQGQFVGRKALMKQCINKIAGTQSGLIGLVGKPGCGKSSLMAAVIHNYVESRHCASGSHVLVHIVGAAPGSSSLVATVRRLSHELKYTFGLNTVIPEDFKNLVVTFGGMLQEAGKVCGSISPFVLFIDGLYLMDGTHEPCSLSWLPHPLPPNVVVVVSAVEGDTCHTSLMRLKGDALTVGALDMFDKADLVRQTLAVHRKELDETPFNNQLKFLMMKKEAHLPLFLKMACEELRVFGVFEKVTSKLKSMSHTMQYLMQETLQRLETDHGVETMSIALPLLLFSREGLMSEELHELLAWNSALQAKKSKISPQEILTTPFPKSTAMPPAVFAFLQRSLQSFLNPLSSSYGAIRLVLAHSGMAAAVRQRYLRGSNAEKEQQLHRLLAGYFMRQADPEADRSWLGRHPRAFCELPYHLKCGGCFEELSEVLCSLRFIHSKCVLGHAAQLMDDFVAKGAGCINKAQEKELAKMLSSPHLQEYHAFVSANIHIIARHPNLTWQQASNSIEDSTVCQEVQNLRMMGQIKEDGCVAWSNKPMTRDPCYMHLDNLAQPATCVALSPDNAYFATGDLDCLVHLYDMATGKELRFFRGHSHSITDVCFVSKSVLCSTSLDATISLWDVEQGHRISLLKGHTKRVNACAADRSGKLIASASWDTTVRIWNATSGENVCDFQLECPVNDVKFHPEGQLIITASWDATIKIFDILYKTRKAVLRGHATSVRAVAFSNDGCHIASAALDGDVKIWSATKGVQVGNIRGHGGPINKLTFSPSGQELITASDDHKVKVWSGELGVPLHVIGSDENGPTTSVALSHDGTTVVVGYHACCVRTFDVGTGISLWETRAHTMPVRAVAYSSDDKYILSGGDDCVVHILTAAQGTKVCTLSGHTKAVLSANVHKKLLATTSEDCTCCLYPPVKVVKANKSVQPMAVLRGHTGPVTSCTFGPGANKIATSSRDMSVCIWDFDVCQMDRNPSPEVVISQCHADWVNSCRWSNTAEFLVTASNDFNLKVWDMKTKKEKLKLQGHTASVNALAYKYGCIVSGASDGQVKVWSHRGTEITTLYGHTQRVNACDVYVKCRSIDGLGAQEEEEDEDPEKSWAESMEEEDRQQGSENKKPKKSKGNNVQDVIVASCSDDGTVRLWRPLDTNTLATLVGHSDRVLAVASDRQGRVATAGLDCSLRLWSPALVSDAKITGQHDVEITCISAGHDGTFVLSADRSGVVNIWQKKDPSFTCVYSLKAHEKSVNGACFVNKQSTRFVTASDDMTMVGWEIIIRKESLFVRKYYESELEDPVSSLTWSPSLMPNSSEPFVIGASWDGSIFCQNLGDGQTKKARLAGGGDASGLHKEFVTRSASEWSKVYKDWPLSVRADNGFVLATAMDGSLSVWTCCLHKQQVELAAVFKKMYSNENEDTFEKNWVMTATNSKNHGYLVGDSLGQIGYLFKGTWTKWKVHDGPITGLLQDNHVFTASKDCTIKVWNNDFVQLGQFYCQAPVTSLCSVGISHAERKHMMAGDQLGNIYLLTWKY